MKVSIHFVTQPGGMKNVWVCSFRSQVLSINLIFISHRSNLFELKGKVCYNLD